MLISSRTFSPGCSAYPTGKHSPPQRAGEIQNLCWDCGRYSEFCSANIDLPGLIQELRRRTVREHGLPASRRVFFEKVLANLPLFHTLLRIASRAQKPYAQGGRIRHLPLFFAGLTQGRVLPAIAERPFRDLPASYPSRRCPKGGWASSSAA